MKQLNKDARKKRNLLISSISIVLVGVLSFGLVFSAFKNTSSKGSTNNKPAINPDLIKPEGEIIITDEDLVNQIKNKILTVPSTAVELNKVTFTDTASSDYETIRTTQGFRISSTGISYGNVTTEDGYFKFYTDPGTYNSDSAFFAFQMLEESNSDRTVALDHTKYDYLTIDFDIWSESKYFDQFYFALRGLDAEGASTECAYPLYFSVNPDGTLVINGESTTYIKNHKTPLHITFVIEKYGENGTPDVRVFLNGMYLSDSLNIFDDIYTSLQYLHVYFPKNRTNSDVSVCVDNFQVLGFGNGDGSYFGSIRGCFIEEEKFMIDLSNISDSVLYKEK